MLLHKKTLLLVLAATAALGAFLRIHHLGTASLVIDEITFVNESDPEQGVIAALQHMYSTYHWQHQPALPRVMELIYLKAVRRLGLPFTEATYRLPTALMGTASVLIIYLLARRLFHQGVGLLAAFLLSTSFFHIFYSREVYNYAPFFLCSLLSLCWLVRLADDLLQEKRPSNFDLVIYAIVTAATLQMMLAGIVIVFSEFLLLLALAWTKPLREKTATERSKALKPLLLSHLTAWIPFVPFLMQLAHYESADRFANQGVSTLTFVKMLGEMGWSCRPIPLTLFLICVVAGCWVSLRDQSTRRQGLLLLFLGLFNGVAIGYIEKLGRYETRYFINILPSLLLFVAVAWHRWMEVLLARFSTRWQNAGCVCLCAVVLLWNLPFYGQLYKLKSSHLCGRCIAEWINQNTPPGTAYILDTPYVRREVPGFYRTPGRYVGAPPPSQTMEDLRNNQAFLRDVFRRFPDAYFVDTQHARPDDGKRSSKDWIQHTFRRHIRLENPALIELVRCGIFPSAAFYPSPNDETYAADIYYNTRDDLIRLRQEAGERWLALFGPEWTYCEVPLPNEGWDHFKALHSEGRLLLYGLKSEPTRVNVLLNCGSYQVAQSIFVFVQGRQTRFDLAADHPQWLNLGEITLQPGKNEIILRKAIPQTREDAANLLAHEIRVEPIPTR